MTTTSLPFMSTRVVKTKFLVEIRNQKGFSSVVENYVGSAPGTRFEQGCTPYFVLKKLFGSVHLGITLQKNQKLTWWQNAGVGSLKKINVLQRLCRVEHENHWEHSWLAEKLSAERENPESKQFYAWKEIEAPGVCILISNAKNIKVTSRTHTYQVYLHQWRQSALSSFEMHKVIAHC